MFPAPLFRSPPAIARPRRSNSKLRIGSALKQKFMAVPKAEDWPAAESLRGFLGLQWTLQPVNGTSAGFQVGAASGANSN
jgi:hypothetical protein